jgi:predicted metal-dependent phosphoesterase TrpH
LLKADFHIHTKYSMDCQTEPKEIVKRCQVLGINCIAISDHDAIEGALETQGIAPFKVIVAEEILTHNGELMGMFLKKHIASGISIEKAIAAIKEQGGLVAIPHPFDPIRGLRLKGEEFNKLAPQIDIIEIFNARCPFGKADTKAREYAKKYNIPGIAGSDAHMTSEIGNVLVTLPEFKTPREFLAKLKEAGIQGKRSSPLVHLYTTLAKIKKIF